MVPYLETGKRWIADDTPDARRDASLSRRWGGACRRDVNRSRGRMLRTIATEMITISHSDLDAHTRLTERQHEA